MSQNVAVVDEKSFKSRIVGLMTSSTFFNHLSSAEILAMADRVVDRAVSSEMPFGKIVTIEELLETVARMCGHVGEDQCQWLELLAVERDTCSAIK